MGLYLNVQTKQGNFSYDIASNLGWTDFQKWAASLPADEFARVKTLASTGQAEGEEEFELDLKRAIKKFKPNASARAVADRLVECCPWNGTMEVSQEPFDEEAED